MLHLKSQQQHWPTFSVNRYGWLHRPPRPSKIWCLFVSKRWIAMLLCHKAWLHIFSYTTKAMIPLLCNITAQHCFSHIYTKTNKHQHLNWKVTWPGQPNIRVSVICLTTGCFDVALADEFSPELWSWALWKLLPCSQNWIMLYSNQNKLES